MQVVSYVAVMLVDISVAIMQVTVSIAIMQLEVSAALMHVTVSAANTWVTIYIVIKDADFKICQNLRLHMKIIC